MFRKWMDEPKRDSWEKDFDNNVVVGVREWVVAMAMMIIPVVNIVILFWWAFADKEEIPASKVNWARGCIIVLTALFAAMAIILGIFFLGEYLHKENITNHINV